MKYSSAHRSAFIFGLLQNADSRQELHNVLTCPLNKLLTSFRLRSSLSYLHLTCLSNCNDMRHFFRSQFNFFHLSHLGRYTLGIWSGKAQGTQQANAGRKRFNLIENHYKKPQATKTCSVRALGCFVTPIFKKQNRLSELPSSI